MPSEHSKLRCAEVHCWIACFLQDSPPICWPLLLGWFGYAVSQECLWGRTEPPPARAKLNAILPSKRYDDEDMEAAVTAVLASELRPSLKMAESLAALIWNIPRSTLHDHVALAKDGQIARSVGHPKQLSESDSQGIVAWTQLRALLRFPVSSDDVKIVAANIAKKRGNPFRDVRGNESVMPSDHWFRDFKYDYPGIKVRRGTKVKAAQVELTAEEIQQTYDILEELRSKFDIPRSDVWNFDECGFDRAIGEKEKLIGPPNMARIQFFQKFSAHVTIGTAINAAGDRMDPFYIFKGSPNSSHDKDAAERMLAGLGADRPGICWTSTLSLLCVFAF
jgi:hypothetical protein